MTNIITLSEQQFDAFYRTVLALGAVRGAKPSEGGFSVVLETPDGCVILSECIDTSPRTFTMTLEERSI